MESKHRHPAETLGALRERIDRMTQAGGEIDGPYFVDRDRLVYLCEELGAGIAALQCRLTQMEIRASVAESIAEAQYKVANGYPKEQP